MATEITSKSELIALATKLDSKSKEIVEAMNSISTTLKSVSSYDGIDVSSAANTLSGNLTNLSTDFTNASLNISNYAGLIEEFDTDDFDMGDTFGKDASPRMYIKEMVNLDLLVDVSDIIINTDPNTTNVVNYVSSKELDGNLTIVNDLHMKNMVVFCKYALTSKLGVVSPSTVVNTSVAEAAVPVVDGSVPVTNQEVVSQESTNTVG